MARLLFLIALLAALIVVAPGCGAAQAPAADAGRAAANAYEPGLGDLMTMTVQPRHIKLALAADEGNWGYAAYEFRELNEALGRIARVWPQWQSLPIRDMITAALKGPMGDLAQAIKSADAARFNSAYVALTEGCNACHQSADRGFIVIQVPQGSPYPDQNFRAIER